jgi:ABC-type siderophore export system fused ATPase/permease subunit
MSVSSYLSPRFLVMRVVWAASVLIWTTFMRMSSLFKGCTHGADAKSRWRELDGT